jgi:hypothetical protein
MESISDRTAVLALGLAQSSLKSPYCMLEKDTLEYEQEEEVQRAVFLCNSEKKLFGEPMKKCCAGHTQVRYKSLELFFVIL